MKKIILTADDFFDQNEDYINTTCGIFFRFVDPVDDEAPSVELPIGRESIEEYRKKFYPDDTQDWGDFYHMHDFEIDKIIVDKFIKGEIDTLHGFTFEEFTEYYNDYIQEH